MKNLPLTFIIALLFISTELSAQKYRRTFSLTVSPYQAFTKKKEMQIGIEKQISPRGAFEFNIGFRFKGEGNPQEKPYFNQTLVSSQVKEVRKGVMFLFFLPFPVVEQDKNWTKKTERREYYVNHNIFLNSGCKIYLVPTKNRQMPGGLYFAPGLTIGNKSIMEYVYTKGQQGYFETLATEWDPNESNPWSLLLGFGYAGTVKVVREDVFNFTQLEIKKYSKTYLVPHLKLGCQLPIGTRFLADFGVQASLNDKVDRSKTNHTFGIQPTVKLGYWF